MINKKGFSLVELLAVIVLIGVLFGIAVPSYSKYIEKTKEAKCETEKKAVLDATKTYITNSIYKNHVIDGEKTVQSLIDENYLSNDYSKYKDEVVEITKDNSNEVNEYNVQLKREDSFKQKCK